MASLLSGQPDIIFIVFLGFFCMQADFFLSLGVLPFLVARITVE